MFEEFFCVYDWSFWDLVVYGMFDSNYFLLILCNELIGCMDYDSVIG